MHSVIEQGRGQVVDPFMGIEGWAGLHSPLLLFPSRISVFPSPPALGLLFPKLFVSRADSLPPETSGLYPDTSGLCPLPALIPQVRDEGPRCAVLCFWFSAF